MSRILIVYASHFGQTRKIAYHLADRLRAGRHEIDVANITDGVRGLPPPEDYDVVVMGSRIEMGRHASDLVAWMRSHLDALRTMPTAVFSVSCAAARPGAGPDPNGYLETLFEDLAWHPTCAVALAGALPYRKYGLILRLVMKQIARSAGHTTDTSRDHELTSWPAVDQFAETVARLGRALDHRAAAASPASYV